MRTSLNLVSRMVLLLALVTVPAVAVRSQSSKVDVDLHFTWMRLAELSVQTPAKSNDVGVGGRITFNINRWVGIEAALDYFPKSDQPGGRLVGLAGVRAGYQGRYFGVFGKARPGILRFDDASLPLSAPPLTGACAGLRGKNFVFETGGIVELYPSRRTLVRFEAGDLRAGLERFCPYPPFAIQFTTHNPNLSMGIGWRF